MRLSDDKYKGSSYGDKATLAENGTVFDIVRIGKAHGQYGMQWLVTIQYDDIEEKISFDGKNEKRNRMFEDLEREIEENHVYQDVKLVAYPLKNGNNYYALEDADTNLAEVTTS